MALGPQNPPPPNFAEDFEKFKKSRSISGPDPGQQPLAYDPAKGTYRDPSTAPEAYGRLITTPRTKAAEPLGAPPPPPDESLVTLPPTGGLLGPGAPEAPKPLITEKLDSGYSDPLTVGELKGRFNFDRKPEPAGTPETGGTPAPRYAFETEDGGLWYFQLEKEYQGGRWEEAEHAEADYQRYKGMDPAFRRATLDAMWGPTSRVAVLIDQQATANKPFSDLKSVLTPFNTQRQISFGEPEPSPQRQGVRDATAQAQVEAQATTPTDIPGGTMRGLLSGPAALLKNIPIMLRESGLPSMQDAIREQQGREPISTEETPSYQMGEWIQEYSDKNYPVPTDRETNFLENLASGFGQMTNYLIGGVVAKQIQVSRWLVPIIFGQSAVDLYEKSKAAGMSDEAAYNSYLIGLGLDFSEAAPIARIFGRVNKSTGGGLRKVMLDIAKSAGEEATQEFLQESAQRKVEVERIEGGLPAGESTWGYFSQAIEAAEIGGIIGATMNILGMAAGLPSMSRTQRREARAKIDKATEDLNKKLNNKGEIQPPRNFKVDEKRIMGVFGTAPQKPNRVVLEDGTVVKRGQKFMDSLQQYGYKLLSQEQIDSLKPGAPPIDTTAEEVPTKLETVTKEISDAVVLRVKQIDTEIAALEASLDLEASAAQETERQAKIERLQEQKRAFTESQAEVEKLKEQKRALTAEAAEEFPERVGMVPEEPGAPEGPDIERIRKGVQPKPPAAEAPAEPIFPKDAADAARERLRAKRGEAAPEPPADLISPEEAKKAAAETPELKEAKQNLLDNAARLRAEAEADVEDARDRVTARKEGLAAATADLKKYTRDLGDKEALFGMAYRKWRLGGEFSVREDDPAVLKSVFEWAQANPEAEQDIRSKTDAIVGKHKVGREGSIGDIRREFYRLTAKWRQAEEEGKVPRPEAEPPTEAFAQFSGFMDEQDPDTTFTLSRKDVPEISQVDKTPVDFDKWEGEWERNDDPSIKVAVWRNKRTGVQMVSRGFAPIGSTRMSDAIARSKRLKGAEKPPEIPDLGQEDDFAAKMNRYPEGTQFTIRADEVRGSGEMGEAATFIEAEKKQKFVGEWEKVLLTPGSGSTGVWKKTVGTPLTMVGPVPSADFVNALGEEGMSSVLKRNTLMGLMAGGFIYDAPLEPSKAKPIVTPQVEALPGMTPLGIPKDPIKVDDRVEWTKEGPLKGRRGNVENVFQQKDQWGRPVTKVVVHFADKSEKGTSREIDARFLKKVSFAPETAVGADAIAASVEQLQKEMEAEDVTEAEKPVGPAPSRTLRIGRGANGQVSVVFNRKDDADLFAAVGRMRRKMQKKGGPEGPGWPRLRELYPEGAGNIAVFSQDYRDQIMEAIKGLPEGETFQAPRPTLKKPPQVAPLPGTEAPPPPGEHPSVQLMADYIAELHVPGPGNVYGAPNYAGQYFAARRHGGQLPPGSRNPGMTEEDVQRIESRIDSFFPDVEIWEVGDKAIWEGKEVEISKIHDPVSNKVQMAVVGTAAGDLEQFDATVGMNELTQRGQPAIPTEPGARGSKNTIFTKDAADAARERLRKKARGDQLNIGFDPQDIADMFALGGLHFEAGARDFGTWSKQMIEDVGEWVRPMLKGSFDMIKQSYEAEVAKTAKATLPEPPKEPTIEEGAPTDAGQTAGPAEPPIQDLEGRGPEPLGGTPPQDVGAPAAGGEGGQAPGLPGERGDPGDRLPGQEPTSEPRPDQRNRPAPVHLPPGRVAQNPNFYRIKPDEIGLGGEATKAQNNINAIQTVKDLEESDEPPTPEQLDAMAKFVGWGQLKSAISPPYGAQRSKWVKIHNTLKKLLSNEEFDTARRSILNAHYTSPEMVKFMWDAVQKMGFKTGNVLEPSMGVGNFLGLAPDSVVDGSRVVGIELDQLTGAMAKTLYPGADIFVKGFQDVYLPNNSFDLVISNVPFGNYKVYDPSYKHDKIGSIHDYFIIKSLDKAKPGGLVAVITSMYTMDKKSTRMRDLMADRADLVLGLRLPNNAFAKNAGTQVTTDLLIFRKRAASETRGGQDFKDSVEYEGKLGETSDTKEISINQYFKRNPTKMLGIMSARGSMYGGKNEPTLEPEGDFSELLTRALQEIPEGVFTADKVAAESDLELTMKTAPGDLKEGAFTIDKKGNVKQRINGILVDPHMIIPKTVKKKRLWIKKNTPQLKSLINLREATKDVLRVQQESDDDTLMQAAQKKLGKLYDQYESAYGLLRGPKTSKLFKFDPQYPLLLALENYDRETKTADKADIFTKRTLFPYRPLSSVSEDPRESLLQVLAETGKADVDLISNLGEKPRAQVIEELEERELIFENPETGEHEISEAYLSGYVVEKLKLAERAAESDPKFLRNVEALKKNQPERVFINGPKLEELISVRLGSTWIPLDAIKDFVRHLDSSPGRITVTYQRPGQRKNARLRVGGVPKVWNVTFPNRGSVANRRRWSGGGVEAQKLLQIALNQGRPKVYMSNPDGSRSIDRESTLAAKAKMDAIKNEFEGWTRTDDKWSPILEQRYNDNMNQIKLRKFNGQHLIYPGMNSSIQMKPHQSNGVWRLISDGRGLLAHPVGSGKTFEMIAAAMELRRMGLVKKPMFAVPNHLVAMWAQEFALLYPGSNVLSATKKDFEPKTRQTLFNRIATGDWDAVIVAHSQIERIPVSKERELSLLRDELNQAREALEQGRAEGDRYFVRRMENTIAALEAKLLALMDRPKDPSILFEDMGVDMLLVDEAHEFKNLFYYTKIGNISGLGQKASGRATAMKLKTDYLLEKHKNRGVVFATATPISNSMSEVFTMARFLAPDVLTAAGIENFDEWSANFGEVIEVNELSPDSQTYAQRSKYARFNNLNEMINQFRLFADVLKIEALNLPVPTLKGGKPTAVKVASHEIIDELFRVIVQRAEALRAGGVDPQIDNWFKLTDDAKKISLDLRMYSGPGSMFLDHPDSKLNMAVETIFQVWQKYDKIQGTQMVFIDNFSRDERDDSGKVLRNIVNLYDDMIEKLEKRGIPREQMADIHDFEGTEARQGAFDRMNAGKIRILFGNRPSMGTGTNAQRRMVALHNLDQPWRPDQLEQGNGRLIRQGNLLFDTGKIDSVEIKQYITEHSFDAYMFQILETKAKMVHAALAGELKERTITDAASDSVLNYSEMKALASGNPDVKLQLDLSMEEARLQALANESHWERRRSESDLDLLIVKLSTAKSMLANNQKALDIWVSESDSGKIFSAVINGISFTERKDAVQYIHDNPQHTPAIVLFGFDLKITQPNLSEGGTIVAGPIGHEKGIWSPQVVWTGRRLLAPVDEEGMITSGIVESIEHRGRLLEGQVLNEKAEIERLGTEQVQLKELMGQEFPFRTELEEIKEKLREVEIRLGMRVDEREDEGGDLVVDEDDPNVTILAPRNLDAPRVIEMSQVDQPPTIPDVGAPTTEGAPAPPLEEQTIRIAVGEEMVPTPATKVAPGVFVHINPAKAEGLEEAEEGRLWSVTHGPSGQAIDNESESKTLAIRLAEKLAAVGDWMRSSAELAADTEFARAVQRLIKDERGFIGGGRFRIPFFNKRNSQKQAIPKEEIKSPDPMVEEALTATVRTGKSLWEGMKGFPREVHQTWGAEFFYEFKVLHWPRFVEGLRRFADAPLDLALEATNEVKAVVKPLDWSQFQIFQKIVVGKDIRENLRREIPQGELTFEQMDEEIGRLEGLADALIMDRVQAHDKMMEEVGDDLIEREKMKPEDRKAHYFTNRVIDHMNKLDEVIVGLPKNLKTPWRWYLKERKGSKGWHEADYLKITHRYLMKVKMDNATDDFVDEQAQNLDAMIFLSPDERTQLFGRYGKPIPKRIYTLPDGQEYKGWQYKEGNVLYPGKTYNEEMILEAVAEGLTVEEWQELEGAQARDVMVKGGKYKVYLLPIEVADRLTEFKGANRSIWARAFVPYMSLWKRVTLDFAGIPFQAMNLLGDDINLYFEDIPALFKQAQAARMLWSGGREKGSQYTGEFEGLTERDIMKMAMDARTIASSALWFEAHQMSPYDDPELSHITKGRGKVARWLLPFPGAKIIERGSAFRESIPRLAKFLKDAERVDRGEKVVVKSTSIEGLTPIEAMGKASRNFTVDYGAVAPMFKDEIRGWMFPFATFYLKNFSNYKHRTKHHFVETATKALVPFGALALWNYTMFPEVEDDLPEWWLYLPHLNTGYKTEDGKDIVIAFSTPVEMAAAMIGLDRLPERLRQLKQGNITYEEAAEGQLKDTLLGAPRTMIDLVNPFAKAIQGVASNKDPWSGRQIVPDALWGDSAAIWPETKAGQEIMAEFIMRTILSPYAQYVRTSRLQEPGEGIYKFLVEGPLDVPRALGYRTVDLSAGERAEWWDKRGIVLASVAQKLYEIEDAYLAWRRGELTNKQHSARRKEILTRGGPGPTDRELNSMERSSRVKVLVLQDELRAETDTKKRQAIILEMDELKYQQQLRAYRTTKRSAKPDVEFPERIQRFFAPGTEAPAPPP